MTSAVIRYPCRGGEEEVGVYHGEQVEDVTDPLTSSGQVNEQGNKDDLRHEEPCVHPVQGVHSPLAVNQKLEGEGNEEPAKRRVEKRVKAADPACQDDHKRHRGEDPQSDPPGEDRLYDGPLQLFKRLFSHDSLLAGRKAALHLLQDRREDDFSEVLLVASDILPDRLVESLHVSRIEDHPGDEERLICLCCLCLGIDE